MKSISRTRSAQTSPTRSPACSASMTAQVIPFDGDRALLMTASSCSERTSIFFCAQAGSFMFSASQTQWYSRCAKRRSVFIRTAKSRTVFADSPPLPSSRPFFLKCSRNAESSFAVSLEAGVFPKYGIMCRSSMNRYRSRVEVFTSVWARY